MNRKSLRKCEKGQSVIFAIFIMITVVFIVAILLAAFGPIMSEFIEFSNDLNASSSDYYLEDIGTAQKTVITFFKYITLFVAITLIAYVLNIAIRRRWDEKEY